jgi:hypothetical protein
MRRVMSAQDTPSYELVITALHSNLPADVRLQTLLKSMLRRHGFRCKSVKPITLKKEAKADATERQERKPKARRPSKTAVRTRLRGVRREAHGDRDRADGI